MLHRKGTHTPGTPWTCTSSPIRRGPVRHGGCLVSAKRRIRWFTETSSTPRPVCQGPVRDGGCAFIGGTGLGLHRREHRFRHIVSSKKQGTRPVRGAMDLSTVIVTPWTCAPERPVRHGLVSGYVVASSGSALSSPLGSKARDLFGASWTCAPVTCSPRTGASESVHRDWNIMDLFIETCFP